MRSGRVFSLNPENAPCKGEVGGRTERLRAELSDGNNRASLSRFVDDTRAVTRCRYIMRG